MSPFERMQYNAVIQERDEALRERNRLTRQLDEYRSEIHLLQNQLENKLALANARRHEQAAEIEQLRRDRAAERTEAPFEHVPEASVEGNPKKPNGVVTK